jgi:hypothetical protein
MPSHAQLSDPQPIQRSRWPWLFAVGAAPIMISVFTTAMAQDNIVFMTGSKLYEACSAEPGTGGELACIAYVQGVNDAMAAAGVAGQRGTLPVCGVYA